MMAMNISQRAVVRVIDGGRLSRQATVSKMETVRIKDDRGLRLSREAVLRCVAEAAHSAHATVKESLTVQSKKNNKSKADQKALGPKPQSIQRGTNQ